ALVHQIQEMITYRKYFNNAEICMLELAKSLLTLPEQAVLTIFGISESEILNPVAKIQKLPQPVNEPQLLRLYYEKTRLRGC
ncbi:MAG: aminoglycoside phosphotransferase family protein, partial [Nostoc sp.]